MSNSQEQEYFVLPPDLLKHVQLPTYSNTVYKEECTQCFDSQDDPSGINVCLTCFNGGCTGSSDHRHADLHSKKTGHPIALNIRRVRKAPDPYQQRDYSDQPPLKKLAISGDETSDQDKFDFHTSIVIYPSSASSTQANQEPIVVQSPFPVEVQFPNLTRQVDSYLQLELCSLTSSDILYLIGPTFQIETAVLAVLHSSSSAQKSEVKAWEEEIDTCSHVTNLQQELNPAPVVQASAKCHGCELSSNLWLCLQCGSLGCGRPQYGGLGGNGHALEHFHSTGHCVNVKMGTITAEGAADLYCYSCDDARTDDRLQSHLARFGIEIAKQEKTEKSMTELQVEQNMKFDFSMSGEDGRDLIPIHGPGLTGLKNLGNSCYIASVLQVLFSLDPFQSRYYRLFSTHSAQCDRPDPANCFDCQLNKIAYGLNSGRYAVPACEDRQPMSPSGGSAQQISFQEGIRPMMFKALIGQGHPEFSTMRQQDADEFMRYLFEKIQRHDHQLARSGIITLPSLPSTNGASDQLTDPTTSFRFELEQKLQCSSCRCVRYRYEDQDALSIPVPAIPINNQELSSEPVNGASSGEVTYRPVSLEQCLDTLTAPQSVEYTCPRCKTKTTALTTTRIATLPRYLLIHARRFAIVNWVPKKLAIPLMIQDNGLDLENYVGKGLQEGEEEFSEEPELAVEEPVDVETLSALESMGFPTKKCKKAIKETGNSGVEPAMNWLFEHTDDLEDGSEDDTPANTNQSFGDSEISMLEGMGFTANQAKKALSETGGNLERAVEWLFSHPDDDGTSLTENTINHTSENEDNKKANKPRYGDLESCKKFKLCAFISHKGPSVHSGHYIAHVLSSKIDTNQPKDWVLFNDEKVALVKNENGELSVKSLGP